MSRAPARPIKRLLIANRGEIATRIISSARELDLETYAIYTNGDDSHAARAAHMIKLDSVSSFMSTDAIITICKQHEIDAVHPGYGFLSESEVFAKRAWEEAGAAVVGPGWGILEDTGNKLKARQLAERCQVPVAPALHNPTNRVEDVRQFAAQVGYPVMVKAVDGGGGRGIRLIREENELASLFKRAIEESPSKQIFAEKAAVGGFRHVEVQIIGDGTGNVTHLWERECSIQRRYQKIIELAPSVVSDRTLVAKVIEDALRMAEHIQYFSLGTFEFLLNPTTKEYYFLEVNPRLQVEHTITESISMTDIVKAQLLLAQGAKLHECGLSMASRAPEHPPTVLSIQLRITAENVDNDWSISIGKITSFQFPTGNGIRVDTYLISGHPTVVSADFDSLIAKLIVTASSWEGVVRKAQIAISDTQITGVKTNIAMLKAIVHHPSFFNKQCDTQWLETTQSELLQKISQLPSSGQTPLATTSASLPAFSTAPPPFRKGDAWSLTLSSPNDNTTTKNQNPQPTHHIELTRIHTNSFPSSLTASLLLTTPSTPTPTPYTVTLLSTTTSASASASISQHRRANPSDPSHIAAPFPGKLVELCVEEGDVVSQGDVLCVIQQMKMEVEVRAGKGGRVVWVMEVEDGEDVGEGMLIAVLEGGGGEALRGKL